MRKLSFIALILATLSKECVYETFNKAQKEDNRLGWKWRFQGVLVGLTVGDSLHLFLTQNRFLDLKAS